MFYVVRSLRWTYISVTRCGEFSPFGRIFEVGGEFFSIKIRLCNWRFFGLLWRRANFFIFYLINSIFKVLWCRYFELLKLIWCRYFWILKVLWCRYFATYFVGLLLFAQICPIGLQKFQNIWSHWHTCTSVIKDLHQQELKVQNFQNFEFKKTFFW